MIASPEAVARPFAFIDVNDGRPTSWPCRPIRVVLDRSIAAAGIEGEIRAAIRDVESNSKFRFEIMGIVDHQPTASWGDDRTAFAAEVIYAVSVPRLSELLDGDELASASTQITSDASGARFVAGAVVFNSDLLSDLAPGMGPMSVGVVATHETLHVLGLDHVRDDTSIMTAEIGDGAGSIGPGDRDGLAALGRSAACVDGQE